MNLDSYLTKSRITSLEFSKKIGASLSAVNKWRQRRRKIPNPKWIKKIDAATKGSVSLSDWYKNKD